MANQRVRAEAGDAQQVREQLAELRAIIRRQESRIEQQQQQLEQQQAQMAALSDQLCAQIKPTTPGRVPSRMGRHGTGRSTSRRALLKWGGAAAAAATVALVASEQPAHAGPANDGDNFLIGKANLGTSQTSLAITGSSSASPFFSVDASSSTNSSVAAIQGISNTGVGVSGSTTGSNGVGVHGSGSGSNSNGVIGSSDSGVGVFGSGGSGTGVYGISSSGYGVYGQGPTGVYGITSSNSSGYGVYGTSTTSSGVGVYGINNSGGTAVYGYSTNGSGSAGVFGTSNSDGGYGVYGYSSQNSGAGYGVYGYSNSVTGGAGVHGSSYGSDGAGVHGISSNSSGTGVHGINSGGGAGVTGSSTGGIDLAAAGTGRLFQTLQSAAGAPSSGTYTIGEQIRDRNGELWLCLVGGSPGQWAQAAHAVYGYNGGATTVLPKGIRLLDTRGNDSLAQHQGGGPYLPSGSPYPLTVAGVNWQSVQVPGSTVAAIGQITAVPSSAGGGYIALVPHGTGFSGTSSLTYNAGLISGASFTVGLSGGAMDIIIGGYPVDVVIDLFAVIA